jgi:formylglycine-generating enzyme required for sulfatase activity
LGVAIVACAVAHREPEADARAGRCQSGMALVDDGESPKSAYCIDRWEAALVESTDAGERAFSPYDSVEGHKVRAIAKSSVVPQAYISRNEAEVACKASKKRLCTETEWVHACEGRRPTTFPYGDDRKTGWCNDNGKPPLLSLYANTSDTHSWQPMNDPRLNQLPGTVAKTGAHPHCKSSFGAYDMMGNVHEWVADPDGTFLGGYFLDTTINGDGCHYKTVAHDATYHDYSTGFRCCADAR